MKDQYSGYKPVEFKGKDHSKGGIKLNALGYRESDPEKIALEIEDGELVSKDNNGDLFVYSDKLGSSDIAKEAIKIKGNTKLDRNTRRIILGQAKRYNKQELQKLLAEQLESEAPEATDEVPEAMLGGLLETAIPFATSNIMNTISDVLGNDGNVIPIENNVNPFKAKYGGKYKVKKYEDGGPYELDNTVLTTDNQIDLLTNPVLPQDKFTYSPLMTVDYDPTTAGNTPLPGNPLRPIPINRPLPVSSQQLYDDAIFSDLTSEPKKSMNDVDLLRAGSTLGSALLSFQPPEKEQLQLPNFNEGNQLVAGTGIDPQALINSNTTAFNTANETVRRASGTVGQYINRLRGNSAQLAKANSQSELTAKQYNDTLALQRANRSDRNATITAQEKIRKQTADSQNQAMFQDLAQNFLNQMSNMATGIEKKRAIEDVTKSMNEGQKKQFLLNIAALNLKNPNFKLSGNILNTIDNIDGIPMEEVMKNLIDFKE